MHSRSNIRQKKSWHRGSTSRVVIFFLLALAMRLTYIRGRHTYREIEPAEVVRVSRSLAQTHWHLFGNPFGTVTGPTAHVAPGYPFLLSLIYSLFGTGTAAEVMKEIACALVSSASIALILVFADVAGYALSAGIIAASLGALLPIKLWIETKGSWDAPYDALALVILCTLTLQHWKQPRFTVRTAMFHGVLWGAAMLFAPPFLPILVAFLVVGWFLFREKRATYAGWACLLIFATSLVLAPWTIRNYRQFGGFVFVRDNLGLELYQANNERAHLTLEENERLPMRPHPTRPQEANELVRLGELQYNHEKLRAAIQWIRDNPRRFTEMTAQRFLYFWFPNSNYLWKRIAAGVITLLAWISAVFAYRDRAHRLPAIMIGALWVVYPMIYYVIEADPRYPYPIYWTLLLMAGLALRAASSNPLLLRLRRSQIDPRAL
jgi:hypothetical protein